MTSESLVTQFPSFFRIVKFVPGWEGILWELCGQLEAIERATGISIYAEDIKEKWGHLRITHVVESGTMTPGQEFQVWCGIVNALVERAEQAT